MQVNTARKKETNMLNFLAVGAGGFIGAAARYAMSLIPLDRSGVFPVNTLITNVLGAFIIGIITAAAAKNAGLSPRMILFLKTGICGGFTTFSTFALETAGLIQSGRIGASAAYMLLSVTLSVAAVLLAEAVV